MSSLSSWLFACIRLLALLPLPIVQGLGWLLGWAQYLCNPAIAATLRGNLQASQVCAGNSALRRMLRKNVGESGKALLETLAIWQRDYATVLSWVRRCDGWEEVEAALAEGKGIIFLTPHLGCFEITSLYYGAKHPVTVLFRPPKQSWLLPLLRQGRQRGKVKLAKANVHGVRALLEALRRREAIGILPDQIPRAGEGEWSHFFGRPAYTMTLASRLAHKSGAAIIMAFGERLPFGRGYHLHFKRLPAGSIDSVDGLNRAIEEQVRQCPHQYLWSYPRHKVPRHAKPLAQEATS